MYAESKQLVIEGLLIFIKHFLPESKKSVYLTNWLNHLI